MILHSVCMLINHPAAVSSERRRPSLFMANSAPVYLFLILVWGLIPLALARTGLRIEVDEFGMVGCVFTFALWLAWCLRGRGLARVATVLEAWTLFYTICFTVSLMTFVAATSQRAFFDGPLAYADRILLPGFDWPGTMLSFSRSGLPVRIANWVYESIKWQPQLLILALALMSNHRRVWHFLLSWITTLCIVVGVFALYPVLGAYDYFGIAAGNVPAMLDPTPWNQPVLLDGLRNGTLRLISLGTLAGIVNFPSFHAGAAVLLAYGFWSIRAMRWIFVTLNTLMLASAVPIGGHYIVDLLAGVIAAAAGIAVAGWITDRVEPVLDWLRPFTWRPVNRHKGHVKRPLSA
ncbi:phosphatase PAP2 family protein [Novosphingobium sp. BL-8A]|uniref:phosphatase PAP2 family protein n=1 Tax=Novosphingobium sp. BL-8A TaxID=3127639 RepID=UPI003757F105